jgi:hypothetical protein
MGVIRAQSHLLDPIEIMDPGLTASVVASMPATSCTDTIAPWSKPAVMCSAGNDLTAPVAADGTLFFFQEMPEVGCDGQAYGSYHRLMRIRPGASAQEVLRLHGGRCLECSGSTCTRYAFGPGRAAYGVTNGALFVWGYYQLVDSGGVNMMPPEYGWVRVSGFPALLDTLDIYLSGGQSAALGPVPPDGFCVASLACWAGFGCIRVLVSDRDGNPINDAQVTLTKRGEGTIGEARTGVNGSAFFSDLEPAQDYTIAVASPGESTALVSDIVVYGGRAISVSLTLRPMSELSGF